MFSQPRHTSPVRRSAESPLTQTAAAVAAAAAPEEDPRDSAELQIETLRQRDADVKDRREELAARAKQRQEQSRKSAELSKRPGSESPTRMSAVANGRRSRNSANTPDLVPDAQGKMVKVSASVESLGGTAPSADESATIWEPETSSPAADEDGAPAPLPIKKKKPARERRSSAAVVPPRELSAAENLIAGHYPTLAQIFGAAHLHTSEPFNLPECVSTAQLAMDKWRGLVPELLRETPSALCYCVQPKDHKKETDVYDIVTESAGQLTDWHEIQWDKKGTHSFNLLWSWSNPHKGKSGVDTSKLLVWQKVNRFPDSKPLTRKDELKRNLQRYSAMPGDLGAAFACFPETFNLPADYKMFLKEFQRVEEEEDGGAPAF